MLQLVDHRGNVVVVDGGARYTGSIARLPAFLGEGDLVDVTLIVGFEAVTLRAAVVEGCDCRPGALAVVSIVEWIAGGRRFVPVDTDLDDAARVSDRRAGMSGRLEQLSLVDVVQLLSTGQRSGVVEVSVDGAASSRAAAPALIGLNRGQVVFARFGNDVGEDALFALLASSRGAFAVRFEKVAPATNIQRSTTFLLLEHLRRLDEAAREASSPVPNLDSLVGAPVETRAFADSSVVDRAELVRPAMSATVVIPQSVVVEPKQKKKRPLPSYPEEQQEKKLAARPGRFSRFFDEVSQSERPAFATPPPVVDDADLAVTDVRFASLAVTATNTSSNVGGGPFERDTDIVDRALISA